MRLSKPFSVQRYFRICALSIGIVFFLNACSDSDDPPVTEQLPQDDDVPVTEQLPQNDDVPGLVVTGLENDPEGELTSSWLATTKLFRDASETPATGDVTVELFQYPQDFRVSQHVDFYTTTLDTCEIDDLQEGGGGGGDDFPLSVSGGTSVTINTAGGTWLEVPAIETGFYESINGFPGVLPADATLSIPGAQFPNVPAYELVAPVDVPVRITPALGVLTAADVAGPFTWEPRPNIPGGYFQITAIAFDSKNNFLGFPVICSVIDDGEFMMPPEVIEAFANTTLTVISRFERVLERVDCINDIVFYQRSNLTEAGN